MVDITYDDLIKTDVAKTAATPSVDGNALLEYGKLALSILEQFNLAKGGRVVESRQPPAITTKELEVVKPMVDVKQIKDALETVKTLKGDIKVSEMLKLLEANKGTVEKLIKGV